MFLHKIFIDLRRRDMVSMNASICPKCGGELKHYDSVQRIIRTKARRTSWMRLRRLRCVKCGTFHRALPEVLFPYKQYEAEVIRGVLEGLITYETIGFSRTTHVR